MAKNQAKPIQAGNSSLLKYESDSSDGKDTVVLDMSSLNNKFKVHQNDADLIADFNKIMDGEEEDFVDLTQRSNLSKDPSRTIDSNESSTVPKSRGAPDKEQYIKEWAQHQTELSTTMVSILSDHDYLSQEHLRGIIHSNSSKQSDTSKDADSLGDDESIGSGDMSVLKEMFSKLSSDRRSHDNRNVLKQIAEKVKQIQSRNGLGLPKEQSNDMPDTLNDIENTTNTNQFSSNHSEALEYYGELKELNDEGLKKELNHSVGTVAAITNRLSADTKKISDQLLQISTKAQNNRHQLFNEMKQNFGSLISDMADELHTIAKQLKGEAKLKSATVTAHSISAGELSNAVDCITGKSNGSISKAEHNNDLSTVEDSELLKNACSEGSNKSSAQKLNEAAKEKLLAESSFNESDGTMLSLPQIGHRVKKKLRKRKVKKEFTADDSTDYTSNSGSSLDDKETINSSQSQVSIVSQRVNELCKTSDNTPNGLREAANLLETDSGNVGLENSGESEIALKTELQSQPSQKNPSVASLLESQQEVTNDSSVKNMAANESILQGDVLSAASEMGSDSNDEINTDEEDDDDIRRLLDFSSLGIKRKLPSNRSLDHDNDSTTTNHVTTAKKPTIKLTKEDELAKILESGISNSIDSSDEEIEKSDTEDIITEEQYLEEQNNALKKEMLLNSSSESVLSDEDFDDLRMMDGHSIQNSNSESNIEDDHDSDGSDTGSLMESFLKISEKIVKKEKQDPSNAGDLNVNSAHKINNEDGIASKEIILNTSSSKRKHGDDSDLDSSDLSSGVAPKKTKISSVGVNIGATLEKDYELIIPSEDEDETKAKKKGLSPHTDDARKNGQVSARNGTLDTSMFKPTTKQTNSIELAKKLQSDRTKQMATSRSTPDDVVSLSSDDDYDIEMEPHSTEKVEEKVPDDEKRKQRKLLRDDQLADDTKTAQKREQERIKRLDTKKKQLTQYIDSQRSDDVDSQPFDGNEILLDYDSKRKEKIVVHPDIRKHLKDHQVDGIKFMYDCCYGSVDNIKDDPGSGCVLAHCMGLGKTLQLITLLHTVISYPQLKTDRILVICPKSTVMNWKDEIERWLMPIKKSRPLKLYQFESTDINAKLQVLQEWSRSGSDKHKQAGCLLMGYEAFRMLVFYHQSKKTKQIYSQAQRSQLEKSVRKYLLEPGADLVVCDEGHMIKNQKSATSLAVNKIGSRRRIVLTGTPIQNNLKEYYSMVNFIKPSFLGTEKEFANLYVNPIKSGQHKDSSKSEIKHMKQRSYVLHKKLSKFVQRREAALLKTFLPAKYEYVLFIPMTECQNNLYEYFLEHNPNKDHGGKSLIPDYTVLRKIWTHPKVLEKAYLNAVSAKTKIKGPPIAHTINPQNNESDDDQPDDVFDSQIGEMSVKSDWWRKHLKPEDLETIVPSNKLLVLFEILDQCVRNNEKCLIFSAFVAVLDVVEFFMTKITEQNKTTVPQQGLERFHKQRWEFGCDYYRLDGKTPKNRRHEMITGFNDPSNQRTRAFLISAKAGGQGINLIGANRVILLDTSWNPSNDQQNIFRVFRLGQKRICYIYRLLAMGTMEEKVYSRSVTKQAMSFRVVDEQQIDRHYSMAELQELYALTKPDMDTRETPVLPKDSLLAHLLHNYPHMVYKYHEHDSLLENKSEQQLSEEEKADAWALYEADVKRKNETNFGPYNSNYGALSNIAGNLGNYANPFYGNYNNLSSALNYPFGSSYGQFNPFANEYNSMGFGDYASFYNNLMTPNYNQSSANMLSPTHASSVTSPSPHLNSFPSARNWMQSLASSTSFSNNLLSSLAQSTNSTSKNNYNSYIDLCNRLGTKNPMLPASNTSPPNSNSPPSALPSTSHDFDPLAFMQQAHLSNLVGSSLSGSTQHQHQQQGPNARNNPMLSKELLLPTRDIFPFSSIPTSVIKPSISTNTPKANSTNSSTAPINPMASKHGEAGVSSSTNDRINGNVSNKRTTQEPQLSIKSVVSLNNAVRNSPDTTNQPPNSSNKPNKVTDAVDKLQVISSVTSTVTEVTKKSSGVDVRKQVSNMGIVYPPKEPIAGSVSNKTVGPSANKAQIPSTSKASGISANKAPNPLAISVTTIPTQPKTNNVITTPAQPNKLSAQPTATIIRKPNASSLDAASNAVHQINNNKALTVTSKRVPVASEGNKRISSPIPIAISRTQLSPSMLAKKPNVMQIIPNVVKAAEPPSISVIPRTVHTNAINENMSTSLLTETSSVSIQKIPPKPITTNARANATLTKSDPLMKIDLTANSSTSSSAKKPRLALNKSAAIVRPLEISKPKSSLENIRAVPRPSQQVPDNSLLEIVELE